MTDQAQRLREMVMLKEMPFYEQSATRVLQARVITIASGKGGVGKSNFATNLAIQLCKLGKRVVIIDADFGLANVEILLGVAPKNNVSDVLNGKIDMESALTEGPLGCMFLSGGTGINSLSELSDNQIMRLTNGFLSLDSLTDCIVIDTRAGLSNVVINFIKAAVDTIIVTTPDPTAIADAYALIKSVRVNMPDINELKLVVNCVTCDREAREVYDKLNGASSRFLGVDLIMLGAVPHDAYLMRAVRRQKPVSILFPNAESSTSFRDISARLLDLRVEKRNSIQNFVLKLIGKLNS